MSSFDGPLRRPGEHVFQNAGIASKNISGKNANFACSTKNFVSDIKLFTDCYQMDKQTPYVMLGSTFRCNRLCKRYLRGPASCSPIKAPRTL